LTLSNFLPSTTQDKIIAIIQKINGDNIQNTSSNTLESTQKNNSVNLNLEEIAKKKKNVVLIETNYATGSGVVINANGDILTNQHVIDGVTRCYAIYENGQGGLGVKFIANVLYSDKTKDLALLKLNTDKDTDFIPLGSSDTITEGQHIVTIGSPKGFINTISEGIISSIREVNGRSYLQITAPITHGSSGGALLNMRGELIGITTLGINTGDLNFAIALSEIKKFLNNSQNNPRSAETTYQTPTTNNDSIISTSSQRKLAITDIETLSSEELALARNEIFARHGYIFELQKFAQYFSKKPWYVPNANYSESDLSEVERYNARFILNYEQKKGYQK
jgi:S1-C subfamily serine protease